MTQVTSIGRDAAIAATAQSLALPPSVIERGVISRPLIAQSLRRIVYLSAPCSYRAARSLASSSLAPLSDDVAALEECISEMLDDLVATGDLLEMRREGADRNEIVLRPAPPAFVRRNDGSFILLGVAGDEITPLDQRLVSYRQSGLRMLAPDDGYACARDLEALGLLELPPTSWLHSPAQEDAKSVLAEWRARLPADKKPEKIEELEVLDRTAPLDFYKGRWTALSAKHVGVFLARRKQRYGARLWSLVDVGGGVVQRLVDIHAKDARMRDCDEAWRLLAAWDAVEGTPQGIGIRSDDTTGILSFGSPLPAWVVRRLSLIGERVPASRAWLAFEVPTENLHEEVRWLEEMLWLSSRTGGDA